MANWYKLKLVGGQTVMPDPSDTTFKEEKRPQNTLTLHRGDTVVCPKDLSTAAEGIGKFELLEEVPAPTA